jgi:AraC-like DNA-binding protein
LAHIRKARQVGLALTLPLDARARLVADRVCQALRSAGNDSATLAELVRGTGSGERTAERIFVKETGMSFGRWRQQARIQFAIRRLSEGATVSVVALECGDCGVPEIRFHCGGPVRAALFANFWNTT